MTVLLRLMCCFLLASSLIGEEPVAPAAALPPASPIVTSVDAVPVTPTRPRRDDFATVTIGNAKGRVTLTTQRASIVRFELLDSHPVSLPEPLRQHMGLPRADRDLPPKRQPLAVLDNFRGDTQHLEYNRHNLLTLLNAAPNLDGTIDTPWKIEQQRPDHATFSLDLPERGLALEMAYTMHPTLAKVVSRLRLRNTGAKAIKLQPRILAVNGIHQDYAPTETAFLFGAYHTGGEHGKMTVVDVPGNPGEYAPELTKAAYDIPGLDYVTVKSRFFAVLCAPVADEGPSEGSLEASPSEVGSGATASASGSTQASPLLFRIGHVAMRWKQPDLLLFPADVNLEPGASAVRSWSLTATSVRSEDLDALTPAEQRIQYTDWMHRFFKVLANGLTWCLSHIWLVVRNYGVAVIILTFLIKALLHRFTFKQQVSMLKMQKLAPQLKLLQERHKSDKQKLGLETMALYKKEGVNPLSGCLPLLIQLPMFMALYQAFNHSADMRGQSFLWINDLTLPDPIWAAPGWFSWVSINPLALIYIATTVWMSFSTKMPPTSDPQQEQMQKMMRWLPVVFGVIFYSMPAGLVLYFTVNAILSTIEIKLVKRKLGIP